MTSTPAPSKPASSDEDSVDVGEGQAPAAANVDSNQGGRETMESLIYAVMLAFLFRAFIAEMFVIPTGSMAATLRGRHVAVKCGDCGFLYHVNASRETRNFDMNGDGQLTGFELEQQSESRVRHVGCPNCGAERVLDPERIKAERSRNGDRIVVNKAAYDFSDPRRWDVIVFKFPGNAKQNYIKRLVGLPHELVKIWRGNIYATPELFTLPLDFRTAIETGVVTDELRAAFEEHGNKLASDANIPLFSGITASTTEEDTVAMRIFSGEDSFLLVEHEQQIYVYRDEFRIVRKPARRLVAMLQLVHDQDYTPQALHRAGYPLRWSGARWRASDDMRTFTFASSDEHAEPQWLRYQHWPFPDPDEWSAADQGQRLDPETLPTVGSLIMDSYAYNYLESGPYHWVGDLAVETTLKVGDHQQGSVWLELVRAGSKYRCRFDLSSGKAELLMEGEGGFLSDGGEPSKSGPVADAGLTGPGAYRLRMSNVDDQVLVWVNDKLLAFDGPTEYVPPPADAPFYQAATEDSAAELGDTAPVGIGVENAVVEASGLRVLRDIYYYAKDRRGARMQDYGPQLLPDAQPSQWLNPSIFANRRQVYFVLGKEQYFPLGDNSPYSSDARLWDPPPRLYESARSHHYVKRDLLIGEALLLYWPRLGVIR